MINSLKRINTTERILQDLFHKTSVNSVPLGELETEFGLSGSELRPILEDLKDEGLIVEHDEGFQISTHGKNFCCRRWV